MTSYKDELEIDLASQILIQHPRSYHMSHKSLSGAFSHNFYNSPNQRPIFFNI